MEIGNNLIMNSYGNKLSYSTQDANEYAGIYCFTFKSNRQDVENTNLIKIGKFTMPKPLDMNDNGNWIAAEKRIKQIQSPFERIYNDVYELNWYYPAKFADTKNTFTDKDFHKYIRQNLGDKVNEKYPNSSSYSEIFKLTADDAKYYFKKFINHEQPNNLTKDEKYYSIRQEQKNGINALCNFWNNCHSNPNVKNIFLFNAIMRFGKCITTYEFIRKNNNIKHVLILSHRPDVFNSWKDDYKDYLCNFCHENKYKIWEKKSKETLESYNKEFNYIIAFISIQDLRGIEKNDQTINELDNDHQSQEIILEFKQKNKEIFNFLWDIVIIDEAHEGILTELAKKMFSYFTNRPKMYILLSGTPFNLKAYGDQVYTEIDTFNHTNSFEYSFLNEQEQQKTFLEKNRDEYKRIENLDDMCLTTKQKELKEQYNYYLNIPELRLLTINVVNPNMENAFKMDYFGFGKFFELNDNNDFVNAQPIDDFLNRLCSNDQKLINYPYSEKCRNDTKCAMWMLPSVNVAKALKKKLEQHDFFKSYKIFDVTGDKYDHNKFLSLKDEVNKLNNKIIILSVKRLTTGITLNGLTTILFLNDTASPTSYYQTMFRVKNPYPKNWAIKKKYGLIFDFNTFRCLNLTYELANELSKNNDTNVDEYYNKLINYFNIHQVDPNTINLKRISINNLTERANKVIVMETYNSGCTKIKNLFDLKKTDDLNKIINKFDGYSYIKNKSQNIIINKTTGKAILSSKKKLTYEQKKTLKKEEIKLNKILGIFVRIPILMLGMYDKLHNLIFEKNISNPSFDQMFNEDMISINDWKSIMSPNIDKAKCIEKKDFKELCKITKPGIILELFKRYLKDIETIFSYISPLEREKQWIEFFQKIQNPNKETVFTPYNVIKLQYDKSNIDWHDAYTNKQKFLDLYAKEALYSYYAACRLYEQAINGNNKPTNNNQIKRFWNKIIYNQIYCCCQNKMFLTITQKILGFKNGDKNICQIDLINKFHNK